MYVAIPFIHKISEKFTHFILILITGSILLNIIMFVSVPQVEAKLDYIRNEIDHSITINSLNLLRVFALDFWMFGLGILARMHATFFKAIIKNKTVIASIIILSVALSLSELLPITMGRFINPLYFIGYVGLAMALCFNVKYKKDPIDISMGIFVWHMPIFNLIIYMGYNSLSLGIVLTLFASLVSYYCVEKPIEMRAK